MADRYKILYEGGEGETEVKKSRFIATTRPVKSEEEAVSFIAEMKKKYWDASHNCSAFTIGRNHELTRCSDDGETAQRMSMTSAWWSPAISGEPSWGPGDWCALIREL